LLSKSSLQIKGGGGEERKRGKRRLPSFFLANLSGLGPSEEEEKRKKENTVILLRLNPSLSELGGYYCSSCSKKEGEGRGGEGKGMLPAGLRRGLWSERGGNALAGPAAEKGRRERKEHMGKTIRPFHFLRYVAPFLSRKTKKKRRGKKGGEVRMPVPYRISNRTRGFPLGKKKERKTLHHLPCSPY